MLLFAEFLVTNPQQLARARAGANLTVAKLIEALDEARHDDRTALHTRGASASPARQSERSGNPIVNSLPRPSPLAGTPDGA